jgi:hypothetical protein
MPNPYGITLDSASIRWAAAEGVPEVVIAATRLLHERSVDEIASKLRPDELEQVVTGAKAVSRCYRGMHAKGPGGTSRAVVSVSPKPRASARGRFASGLVDTVGKDWQLLDGSPHRR